MTSELTTGSLTGDTQAVDTLAVDAQTGDAQATNTQTGDAQTGDAQAATTQAVDAFAAKPSIATPIGAMVSGATFIEGGLGAVRGLRCSGVWAGFRRNPKRRDLALVVADTPAIVAGVFTRNVFCAAPVMLCRKRLAVTERISAVVLNSGNANASTGEPGMHAALRTTQIAAQHLGCEPEQVLVASTGVIGVPLNEAPFETGIPQAIAELGASDGTALSAGLAAAEAIMTTDTHPKQAAVTVAIPQSDGSSISCTIGGMVKGSGMIQPDMATLLGVLGTDAPLSSAACNWALRQAVARTLNKVTIDSDTSTNDSIFLLATGEAECELLDQTSAGLTVFVAALEAVCEDLARQIAYDGEGATRLVTVNIVGAVDDAQADLAGRAVANSPLVKTAIAGHDANWGRIAMAIGKSGASFDPKDVNITIMGMPVCQHGLPVIFDEDEALRRFESNAEIVLEVDLGAGGGTARLWTCDLTHEYITINGDYRT